MPIVRTYACPACNHFLEVTLRFDQWDEPDPVCPECQRRNMQQEFVPPRINGSNAAKARAIAEDIAGNDYHVADMQIQNREGNATKVRYKDQSSTTSAQASTWGITQDALSRAVSAGRDTRLRYGNGLDVLQKALQTGDQPDLIAASKKRAIRVW
jgi:hypothetical protein